jgi:hypothetical protein
LLLLAPALPAFWPEFPVVSALSELLEHAKSGTPNNNDAVKRKAQ